MGINVENSISWSELQQLIIEEYCPREEIQKLEQELWNLTIKEVDVSTYTSCFNDASTLFFAMVTLEYKKTRSYI